MLFLLCIAPFMVALDFPIVNLALASIGEEFGAGSAQLQWVVSGYVIAFGGFLLLCGKATDVYGPRRVLVLGLPAFASACVVAALAGSLEMLVAARVAQGVAAAMIAPAALSLLLLHFSDERTRDRALGMYFAAGSIGFVLGLILGGVLTDAWSWRAVMWVNVPPAVGAACLIVRRTPASRGIRPRRLDGLGAILVTAASLSTAYGLSTASEQGLSAPKTLGALLGGLTLVGALVLVERRRPDGLVPGRIFRIRGLLAATVGAVATGGPSTGSFFLVALYLQQTRAYTASETAAAFIPFAAASLVGYAIAPRMLIRRSAGSLVARGLCMQALGALLLMLIVSSELVPIIIGTLVIGVGIALAMIGTIALGTSAVDADDRGVVSGVLQAAHELGVGFGLAVLVLCAAVFGGTSSAQSGYGEANEIVWGYASAFLAAALLSAVGALTIFLMTRGRIAFGSGEHQSDSDHVHGKERVGEQDAQQRGPRVPLTTPQRTEA